MYAHHDAGSIKAKEGALNTKRKGERTKILFAQKEKADEKKKTLMMEKQNKRNQLVTFATKKQSLRSSKPAPKQKKNAEESQGGNK